MDGIGIGNRNTSIITVNNRILQIQIDLHISLGGRVNLKDDDEELLF